MPEWPKVKLGSVAKLFQPSQYTPSADEDVKFAGVRWYGAGVFVREKRKGSEVKGKAFQLEAGRLVYNRLFGWKQAFAVVPDDFAGVLVSNEFPQFCVDDSQASTAFVAIACASPQFAHKALALSTGSAAVSRNRLHETDFMNLEIPLPPRAIQDWIVGAIGSVDDAIASLDIESMALKNLLQSMRESLLEHAQQVPLTSVCSMSASLVDPKLEEHADLIHIGIDAIEKDTGRLTKARTAREDGVISGKYFFGPEDVIYSKIRPELRKAAHPGYKGLCSADAYPLTPAESIAPELLREMLLESRFTTQVKALSARLKMPKVNKKELFSTVVALPNPDERDDITSTLSGIRMQLELVMLEAEQLRETRAALLDAMLGGDIDLSVETFDPDENGD